MNKQDEYDYQTFYIMKAYHLTTSGRKLGLAKISKEEPGDTVLVVEREHGMSTVRAFIIGSGHGYRVSIGETHGYIIDTGNGYKGRGSMKILDIIEIDDDGDISRGNSNHENAATWVMK